MSTKLRVKANIKKNNISRVEVNIIKAYSSK